MRRTFLRAAVASALAGPAAAQTGPFTVSGGGSTLAMNLYNRTAQAIATPTGVGLNVLTQGLNTAGPAGMLAYTAAASARGQLAFLAQDLSVDTAADADAGATVHYGASDAYLTADQLACWNEGDSGTCTAAGIPVPAAAASLKGGPLIQLPAVGTPVTIAHTVPLTKTLYLDDNDLCGIFSGRITDWSGIETKPDGHAPRGLGGAIAVVYRQDGSGTSFLFTQHLSRVCTAANTAPGVTFAATKYFADAFGSPVITCNDHLACEHAIGPGQSPAAASFTGASTSAGVADTLINGAYRVSYLTPDYTAIAPKALAHYAKVASLLGLSITDPGVQPSLSPYQYIQVAKLYNRNSATYYAPTPGAALQGLDNPGSDDVGLDYPKTKTTALNPLRWIPQIADPIQGYPVVGFTTLDLATCYADPQVQNYLIAFLTQLYAPVNRTNLKLEGFVPMPSGYVAAIMSVFVKGTSTYAVNIGNPGLCNDNGFPGTAPGL
jgi:ABC-type phosphate transport system substrate-binding protein